MLLLRACLTFTVCVGSGTSSFALFAWNCCFEKYRMLGFTLSEKYRMLGFTPIAFLKNFQCFQKIRYCVVYPVFGFFHIVLGPLILYKCHVSCSGYWSKGGVLDAVWELFCKIVFQIGRYEKSMNVLSIQNFFVYIFM